MNATVQTSERQARHHHYHCGAARPAHSSQRAMPDGRSPGVKPLIRRFTMPVSDNIRTRPMIRGPGVLPGWDDASDRGREELTESHRKTISAALSSRHCLKQLLPDPPRPPPRQPLWVHPKYTLLSSSRSVKALAEEGSPSPFKPRGGHCSIHGRQRGELISVQVCCTYWSY